MTETQARQHILSIMQGWVGLKRSDGSHKVIIDHRSCRFQNLQDISVAGGKFLHEEIQLHLQITD